MNNQYPVSNFPLIPPANPNPNLSNPQFHWAPPPPQTVIHDLPNSLASLKTLIQSCNSTLQSISSLVPSISPNSKTLIQCPSNPNHWVPSSSLFLHSLSCPSPLDIGRALETLHYPKTLKNDGLIQGNKFFQPLDDPTSELCFSIDDFVDFDSDFFYRDCPGVVSSLNNDASNRIFTLPGVLSVECANFVGFSDTGSIGFGGISVRVLPSEVWFVQREVEQWSDYPNAYSLSVCRVVLCVEYVHECDLSMWLIEKSSRFGIVIDVPMRDHLCVLFRLCLKAMVREAACSYRSLLQSHIDDQSRKCNPRSLSFKCPVLAEVSRWLTLQLSILYGEMNSRSFVVAMLRHLLSKAASRASLFPVDGKLDRGYSNEQASDVPRVHTCGKVTENEENDSSNETIFCKPIFVYQIAAAIAALHERSLLEERIRKLRNPYQLTPYQRLAEHSHFSKKADEERQKRPEYRPLIEHDSLLNSRQHDQGGNKPKTKEELLAEERDYKRRRMSYRGKKSKRSAKEVMRDIIEDYMEAIKHMEDIEGPPKGDTDGSVLRSTNSSALPATSSKLNHGSRTDMQDDNRTLMDNDYNYRDTKPIHASKRLEQYKKESHSHGHSDDRKRHTSRDRRDRDYDSRSPGKDRRHRSREHRSHSRSQVSEKSVDERSKSNYYSSSNHSSHHYYKLQSSTSSSLRNPSDCKDKRKLDSPDRQIWQPDSFESVEINDRYDPSETSHTYDDRLDDNSNNKSQRS